MRSNILYRGRSLFFLAILAITMSCGGAKVRQPEPGNFSDPPPGSDSAVPTDPTDSNDPNNNDNPGEDSEGPGSQSEDVLKYCKDIDQEHRIHISGQKQSVSLIIDQPTFIKVSGNINEVTLGSPDLETPVSALCIVVTGNQNKVTANLNVHITRLVYVGDGNQSQGIIHMLLGFDIDELIGKLTGNKASLNITGVPVGACNQVFHTGNLTSATCTP